MLENHNYEITLTKGNETTTVHYSDSPIFSEGSIDIHLEFLRELKIYDRIYAKLLNPVYQMNWYYDSLEEEEFEEED